MTSVAFDAAVRSESERRTNRMAAVAAAVGNQDNHASMTSGGLGNRSHPSNANGAAVRNHDGVESQDSHAGRMRREEGGSSYNSGGGAFQYRPQSPIPISLQHWMRLTDELLALSSSTSTTSNSTMEYVKSAVKLSWMLTKHLRERIAAADISLSQIAVGNVVIFVDPPSTNSNWQQQQQRQSGNSQSLAIQAVHFQPGEPLPMSAMSTMSQLAQNAGYSRDFCALLGNILLEIFSRGRLAASHGGVGSATITTPS